MKTRQEYKYNRFDRSMIPDRRVDGVSKTLDTMSARFVQCRDGRVFEGGEKQTWTSQLVSITSQVSVCWLGKNVVDKERLSWFEKKSAPAMFMYWEGSSVKIAKCNFDEIKPMCLRDEGQYQMVADNNTCRIIKIGGRGPV